MKNHEMQNCLEILCADIISCANMEDIIVLKEKALRIRREMLLGTESNLISPITSRIETGPTQIGWGKGKDE